MNTKELLINEINHAPEHGLQDINAWNDQLTSHQLGTVLNKLDVHFLAGEDTTERTDEVPPAIVIHALAISDEARLRLALIPLFLRHPEFALDVEFVSKRLSQESQIMLKCYFTAAHFLQKKYHSRLQALFGDFSPLPDLFGCELGLLNIQSIDDGLTLLARRHCLLSGRPINWLGTYEHGARRLLTHYECKRTWQRSQ